MRFPTHFARKRLVAMLRRILPAKRCLILSVALVALLCTPFGLAEPVPGKQDRLVVQMVTEYLKRAHLMQPEIGDELSKRLFKNFFKNFDPMKLYFMKSDIEEFRSYETELDDMLLQGDISFAYKGYERYMQRLAQRLKLVDELVAAKHDFTVKEYLDVDYDKLDFASTDDELRDRWRKRIKFAARRRATAASSLTTRSWRWPRATASTSISRR
jgi:carboxyl-terminal processing protease